MKIEVRADDDSVARDAAKFIAETAQDGIATRGKFVMAVSRGKLLKQPPFFEMGINTLSGT